MIVSLTGSYIKSFSTLYVTSINVLQAATNKVRASGPKMISLAGYT